MQRSTNFKTHFNCTCTLKTDKKNANISETQHQKNNYHLLTPSRDISASLVIQHQPNRQLKQLRLTIVYNFLMNRLRPHQPMQLKRLMQQLLDDKIVQNSMRMAGPPWIDNYSLRYLCTCKLLLSFSNLNYRLNIHMYFNGNQINS